MLNLERAFSDPSLCRSLTGMNPEEIEILVENFETVYQSRGRAKSRQRAFGGGRKSTLTGSREKVFFLLFYLKVYPTFAVAGFLWDVHRATPEKWVKKYLPILEETLGHLCVLPERKIESVEAFLRQFPKVKDVLIDGTERPIRRPSSSKNRRKQYSGKKQTHTRKNGVMSDENKRILVLTPTKHGRLHDKKQADKFHLFHGLPEFVTAWVDKGYQGAQKIHPNIMIPHKATKKKPLTQEQKQENQIIASLRMPVEHIFAGLKKFNALSHTFRNRIQQGGDDLFLLIAAGIWNLQLSCQ